MMSSHIDVKPHQRPPVVSPDAIQHHRGMRTLGERLLYAIQLRDIGFNELDRAIGQGSGYTSRLVRDLKERPDVFLINKIARELHVDFEWLVSGRGPVPVAEGRPVAYRPLCEYPGFERALAEAKEHYRSIPAEIWERVAHAVLPDLDDLSTSDLGRTAQILYDHSPGQPGYDSDVTAPHRQRLAENPPASAPAAKPLKTPATRRKTSEG
jgi:hypothetical protein